MARRSNISGQNLSIRIENNVPLAEREMRRKTSLMLTAIGEKWRSIVTQVITTKRIVDTGALRRSMNFEANEATKKVQVGSLLDYATKQEFSVKGPYLKPSILNYKESYKNICEHIMEE